MNTDDAGMFDNGPWYSSRKAPADLFMNYVRFCNTPHQDRMNYTGDAGFFGKNANLYNKTSEHVEWVKEQILKDRATRPYVQIDGVMGLTIREAIRHAIAELRDAEGPGGLSDEYENLGAKVNGPNPR